MHYGKIREIDVSNGVGVRVSLFVSGCRNCCDNCFQPETWDFNYGELFSNKTSNYIIKLLSRPYIDGLTILGGEPMEPENQIEILEFVKLVKEKCPDKSIWCYTGYTIEELLNNKSSITHKLLEYIDVIVDGRYDDSLYDISLRFKGSRNQRIIDVKKTLAANKVVEWDERDEGASI